MIISKASQINMLPISQAIYTRSKDLEEFIWVYFPGRKTYPDTP